MICKNCGAVIADDSVFCGECGTRVSVPAPEPTVPAAEPMPDTANVSQPQQPVYGQPQQPVYGQPQQPVYGQPQQPVYGQPNPYMNPQPAAYVKPPKKFTAGNWLGLIGVVLCIISFFLPIASAWGYSTTLLEGFDTNEIIAVLLIIAAIFLLVLIIAFSAKLNVLALVFSILLLILNGILLAAMIYVSGLFSLGVAFYLILIGTLLCLIGSIVALATQRK